jgi:hypothetical protein
MKQWLKKITGIEAKEQALADAAALAEQERKAIEDDRKKLEESELELLKKRDPKAYANRKGEPWVSVLDVKVNKENIRNGFFELDWNDHFIQELIQNGYGVENDPQEEIVDRWFRDIIYQMLDEEGLDKSRGAGYINVVPISKGKAQVS